MFYFQFIQQHTLALKALLAKTPESRQKKEMKLNIWFIQNKKGKKIRKKTFFIIFKFKNEYTKRAEEKLKFRLILHLEGYAFLYIAFFLLP